MAGGIELAPLITKIKVDTASFKSDMQKAAILGKSEADKMSKSMSSLTKVGDSLTKTGAMLTKGVTVPLVGAGVAVTKMAMDYESSFAKVSTLLDENVVDFDKYKESLITGSNETKVAVGEYSESVYQAISAGVDQTKATEFTTEAMKLAKGGFTSGASAVDILTTAINGYNLSADDATKLSDMLITTQNLGKTTVDELANSMGKVIPIADSVNFGMDELSASYAQLTKNGIATAEAGTYMKQMLSELGKAGSIADKALRELSGKSFAELKSEGVATSDILNMMSQYAEQDGKTLKDMFGSVEAGSAALVLAKGDGQEYNEMLAGMQKSAGATQDAFDKMNSTPAEQLKGALNELKNSGIELGEALIPVITDVSGVISDLSHWFSSLSQEQQQNIIKWAGVTAAAGPAMSVLGKGVKTFTTLAPLLKGANKTLGVLSSTSAVTATTVGGATTALSGTGAAAAGLTSVCAPLLLGVAAVGTGIYAIHENGQLMKRTVTESTEEMSGMEKVLAKLQGVEVKSRKEMEELGWVHEEFSDKISPEFQEAVEESTKKVQDFNIYVSEMGFDDVISPDESEEFNNRVEQTCNEVIQTIQSKKEESQEALKNLFVADDNVVDEGEQRVLDILSESSDNQISEVQNLKDEIIAIKQKAVDDGRALNEQEIADIESKNTRIREIELEALGGTQEEIMYAKNEFAARAKNIDVQSASELMQDKAKIRDEEIVKIQASYDTEIEKLKTHLGEKNGINDADIQQQIDNLEKDKQTKVQKQQELYDEYLRIIEENNPKLLDAINKYTGKELTQADIHSQDMLAKYKGRYDGINQITESGCYRMYDTVSGAWSDVAVTVDSKTGEITGMYDKTSNIGAGYCEKMAKDAENMANKQSGAFQQICNTGDLYIDEMGNITHKNGEVAGSMDELRKHTDGTRTGIIDINGTPYNIKVEKDGTISALDEIDKKANYVARARTLNIEVSSYTAGSSTLDNYIATHYNGSRNFNGIDNVPYDGYRAILHKGERVLTAEENKAYPQPPAVDYDAIRSIVRRELGSIVIEMNNRELGRAIRRL